MKKQTNATIKAYVIQCAPYLLLLATGTVMAFFVPQAPIKVSHPAAAGLTFAERVSYQRAIEEVYWRHRTWPKENPNSKPALDAVMSEAQLEKKVEEYLLESQALEDKDHESLTAEQLQAEMERMATHSKQPAVLRELFQALGDDPFVIAECLARPVLSERLTTNLHVMQANSGGVSHGGWKAAAPWLTPTPKVMAAVTTNYTLPKIADGGNGCTDDTWTATSTTNAPEGRQGPSAVWTGTEMIIWGGSVANNEDFNTGGRYVPSTDSWTPTSTVNAPRLRVGNSAVWTGTEMIIWGGEHCCPLVYFNNGGRYNPITDTWVGTSTTGAPERRSAHTAIWTGTEMIIWGGFSGTTLTFNTGGRYNPNTDSWVATSTASAPLGRIEHTAVWTGSEMIVWGGYNYIEPYLNTGGRYNPVTDSWVATTTLNAPSARDSHTAIWSGTEMIVWGGGGSNGTDNSGGRYDPFKDSWIPTSMVNAPSARVANTAVWTGSEMMIWGGAFYDGSNNQYLNTGGRYNPFTDSWTATTTVNAPSPRDAHVAVWTGTEMIVWGGFFFDGAFHFLDSGGKYCAEVGPTPTPTPTPITLHGEGKKVQGINTVRLTWSGASSAKIDVYRDGGVIVTTPNDGVYADSTGDINQASYTYRVCEATTQTCSNEVVVSFNHQTIDATWSSNPVSGDWNDPLNWTPHIVPNGQLAKATFNTSTITDISLSDTTTVKEIVFNPGASAFTITIPAQKTFAFNGSGVTNDSGQEQSFTVTNGGVIKFQSNATAGSNALYSCDGTIHFYDSSNGGESMFVYHGGAATGSGGGFAEFRDNSSAADATFIVEAGTVAGASGGTVAFFDGQVSAGNATIIVNGGTVAGAKGANLTFYGIQPSEPTIICNGGLNGGKGAELMFFQDIPGNLAHVQLTGDAFMDMSISGGVTLGSLAGHGLIDLGDFTLTVGGNNQDTLFSGLLNQVNTEGYDAGLKKVGSGTLSLNHDNRFKGGITIAGGTVVIQNKTGSASGYDGISVEEGTLAGGGITAGGVTIGTGSGPGAFLAPGQESTAETLTIQQLVIFQADGTYTWKFNTNKAAADQVIGNGVSIHSGAQFTFLGVANNKLTAGTVFTAISNTSASPIGGTFANLADGSTVAVGANKFQVSYEGGDGNDLTLTVVP